MPAGSDHGTDHGHLVSGEAVQLEIRIARPGSRVLALLLDIGIEIGLFFILGFVAMIGIALLSSKGLADAALARGVAIVVIVVVLIGYPVTMETLTGGRTLGKLALGLRVVRDDGGPIRFRHAFTRALVSVALEWPGLVMPLVTWAASLLTMLFNPRGKRLGDLAAGTIVIHERAPASWGWVPAMPPPLASWARNLDLTALDDSLALAVRHFLARNRHLAEPFRSRLGFSLASDVAAKTTPLPPPGVPGWMYLAAVTAERHRRAARLLTAARIAAAPVWPDLAAGQTAYPPIYNQPQYPAYQAGPPGAVLPPPVAQAQYPHPAPPLRVPIPPANR